MPRSQSNHLRRIIEAGDQLRCKDPHQNTDELCHDDTAEDSEQGTFFDPVIELGTVVEAAEGLEALSKTDHGGSAKLHKPLYYTHSCD